MTSQDMCKPCLNLPYLTFMMLLQTSNYYLIELYQKHSL